MSAPVAVLWGLITAVISGLLVYVYIIRPLGIAAQSKMDAATDRDRRSLAESEMAVQRAELDARERTLGILEAAETEAAERTGALVRAEERISARDIGLNRRIEAMEAREADLSARITRHEDRTRTLERHEERAAAELARVADLDPDSARAAVMEEARHDYAALAEREGRAVEAAALARAEANARRITLDVIARSAVEYVTEATLAVVELPSEDMKGRIIGREGRNIRAFEQTAGVDLIIDETPESVVISCFDPVRREVARLTLMNLMLDGRIHPGRIEELHEKARQEVDRVVKEAGERAAERADVAGLPPRVLETLGRLRFRTSYAQNVLDHSVEVARLCENLAHELGYDAVISKRAGLLHDIGKALPVEVEGPHALTGMAFLEEQGERPAVLIAVGAHHREIEPSTPEAQIVIIADTISAARPGARRESLEHHMKRLKALEELANSFPGVERSFAVQAGRELRLIVRPDEVDDAGAVRVANEVAGRIEREMEYPGQIKITVVRETRVTRTAK